MQVDDAASVIDDELIVSTIETSVVGTIRLTGALIKHLKKQDSATVLIIASVLGFTPMATAAVYSSTRAALHSYAQSLRFKLRNTSVRVLEIIPPWVRTELLNSSEDLYQLRPQVATDLDKLRNAAYKLLIKLTASAVDKYASA